MINIKGVKIMRKLVIIFFISFLLLNIIEAKAQDVNRKAMVDSMKTIDPEVKKYFPRWKICETDLQIQIYKTFQLLGYPEDELDMTQIEVMAIPRVGDKMYEPFEILTINCGRTFMNTSEIETNMGVLLDFISGSYSYLYNYQQDFPRRDYCYTEIPPSIPVSENQQAAILNYLEPTNVTHSFSVSLFDQSLKIGESMFWLKSSFGTDEVGYPFWYSGEAKVFLKRPLFMNKDGATSRLIPQLINIHLGGGYRIRSGLANQGGLFDFLPNRLLNGAPNGKLIAGFDFNMPFHPFAGFHFNYEGSVNTVEEASIEKKSFGRYNVPFDSDGNFLVNFNPDGSHSEDVILGIIPILNSTGQISIFYNWWIDKKKPEDYFRFDLGISYSEVQEYAFYSLNENDPQDRKLGDYMTKREVDGLKLYKPESFAEWLYMKAEYRSQSAYPFGMSIQMSNQIFLGRVYIPLLSPWLYLEGKYSTPLRDARPYEIEHYFMISPVLRITI
jgi:hypothetical protein